MGSLGTIRVQIPQKLQSVFTGPARYRGAYGGRGSGKSWSFARMLLIRSMQQKTRILCTREFQNSIKESVHRVLVDQMEQMGFQGHFDYGANYLRGRNGSEFIFKGLRFNYQEIKSTEGIDICWVEEAHNASPESLRILKPTIRNPNSEIWFTWNSESEDAAVHQDFVISCPDNARIVKINWRDNPWFPQVLEEERRMDMAKDPDLYDHVWEGECLRRSDAVVMSGKWRVERFERPHQRELTGGPYYGCDWGFSTDPLALVCCYIIGNRLYIEQETGGVRIEIQDTPREFDKIPNIKKHVVRADNARPELIKYMQRKGFNIIAAPKWEGSVADGITHLRSYREIVIHERCVETQREAKKWSYKVDRLTGDVLPILVDAYNHYWDAIRYALAPLIIPKRAGVWGTPAKDWGRQQGIRI